MTEQLQQKSPHITDSLRRVSDMRLSLQAERFVTRLAAEHEGKRPQLEDFAGTEAARPIRVVYDMKDGERVREERNIFERSRIEANLRTTEEKKRLFAEREAAMDPATRAHFEKGRRFSAFMEEVAMRYGLMFPEGTTLHPVSEFTDIKQGVDMVAALRVEGKPVQFLALDFTYADTPEELTKKFSRVVDEIKKGTLATASYLEIDEEKVEIGMIPRVIVAFSDATVAATAEALSFSEGRGVRPVATPQVAEFARLMRMQIQRQMELIQEVPGAEFVSFPPFKRENTDEARAKQRSDMVASLADAAKFLSASTPLSLSDKPFSDEALMTMRSLLTDRWDEMKNALMSAPTQGDDTVATPPMAAAVAVVSAEGRGGGETVPPTVTAVAAIPAAIMPTSTPVDVILPANNTSPAPAEPRTLSDFEKIPVGQRARVMTDMQAEIARLNADTERMRRARTEAPPAAPPEPRPVDARTEPVASREPHPAADPAHRTTPDAHHGAPHAADGHAHGEHHGHAHGHHDHGEPWHLPRNLYEAGQLGAATVIGAWNVTKWIWNYIVHPTVHTAGYVATGDAKHPWQTFWSNIKKEFGKSFSKKGGGGGHGGGSHGGGGHGHGGGGHH